MRANHFLKKSPLKERSSNVLVATLLDEKSDSNDQLIKQINKKNLKTHLNRNLSQKNTNPKLKDNADGALTQRDPCDLLKKGCETSTNSKDNLLKNLRIKHSASASEGSGHFKCTTARNFINNLESNIPLKSSRSIAIPNYEPAKCSLKGNGIVEGYSATTNQGIIRYPNLLIIETIMKTEFP